MASSEAWLNQSSGGWLRSRSSWRRRAARSRGSARRWFSNRSSWPESCCHAGGWWGGGAGSWGVETGSRMPAARQPRAASGAGARRDQRQRRPSSARLGGSGQLVAPARAADRRLRRCMAASMRTSERSGGSKWRRARSQPAAATAAAAPRAQPASVSAGVAGVSRRTSRIAQAPASPRTTSGPAVASAHQPALTRRATRRAWRSHAARRSAAGAAMAGRYHAGRGGRGERRRERRRCGLPARCRRGRACRFRHPGRWPARRARGRGRP